MKQVIILFTLFVCAQFSAQNRGLLPYSGAIFEKSGISFEEIELEVEDQTWISNILPIGKELKINVKEPKGFVIENELCYPGISIFIGRENGDTIGYAANIFEGSEGLDASMLSNLSFTFSLKDSVKVGEKCKLEAMFFDTKSDKNLLVKLNFTLGEADIIQSSNFNYSFSSTQGYKVNSNLEMSDVKVKDTLINNKLFQELKLNGISISKEDLEQLKTNINIFSSDFYTIEPSTFKPEITINKYSNSLTKKEEVVIYVLKNKDIPLGYQWHIKLENHQKQQIIEILNPF